MVKNIRTINIYHNEINLNYISNEDNEKEDNLIDSLDETKNILKEHFTQFIEETKNYDKN